MSNKSNQPIYGWLSTACKRTAIIFLVFAMVVAAAPWAGDIRANHIYAAAIAEESAPAAAAPGTQTPKAVTVPSTLGEVTLQQTKTNYTGVTVHIAAVNDILTAKSADHVRITAKMYYEDTVTQNVVDTFALEQDKTTYTMDFENFGKFSVTVEYLKGTESVCISDAVTVGIVADVYNLAPISATFPAVLFSLSLWEQTDYCITKDDEGNPIPTIAVFERASSWDWNRLPENVYKLPNGIASDFEGITWGGQKWLATRNRMSAYIRDLYEIGPDSFFQLYYTDNFVENMLLLLVANQIPESQYKVVLLSDGSGTYSYFNDTFASDSDGALYDDMRRDWEELKSKTRAEGKFNPAWAKYHSATSLTLTTLPKYAAVAAEDENVEWWVARTSGTFKIDNEELLQKVIGSCTVKGVSAMLKSVQGVGKDEEFKALYHFDNDMFEVANQAEKPIMLFLGSTVNNEPGFRDYAELAKAYYGDTYVYYYKGHPGTPTGLYPSKQSDLDALGIIDVDSSIPAELILFFFPDIYMCGYDSSTFQSVESAQMACGMFNMTKENGLTKTYGELLDFFASSITNSHPVYGALCPQKDHTYYLLEFNNTTGFDIAVFDATEKSFAHYKNTASSDDEAMWDKQQMIVENIADCVYTGEAVEPDFTVRLTNGTILTLGKDYTVSFESNLLVGEAEAVVKGIGLYAPFGEIGKTFSIQKAVPVIKTPPKAGAITEGQSLAQSVLTDGEANVEGNFTWKNPETKPSAADSGSMKFPVIFTPADSLGYNAIETEISVTVNPVIPDSEQKEPADSEQKETTDSEKQEPVQPTPVTLKQPVVSKLNNTSKGIEIRWKVVEQAAGYHIERKKAGGRWSRVATINNGKTAAYTDKTVKTKNAVMYVYRIQAYQYNVQSEYSVEKTICRLKSPSISKCSNEKGRKITVKCKKVSKISGYELQYALNKKFKNAKSSTSKSVTLKTAKLQKNKRYYLRIRTYKTVSGITYYSDWCDKGKSIKVKK